MFFFQAAFGRHPANKKNPRLTGNRGFFEILLTTL